MKNRGTLGGAHKVYRGSRRPIDFKYTSNTSCAAALVARPLPPEIPDPDVPKPNRLKTIFFCSQDSWTMDVCLEGAESSEKTSA